jgi:hypothetical protein
MINVLSQPYLSLDSYVDLKDIDNLVDSIIIGIAKSKYASGPTATGPGYLDKSKQSVFEIYEQILKNPTHQYHNVVKNMNNWEPLTFIQYKYPSHSLGQCLVLRTSGISNYEEKHDDSKCKDTNIIKNFDMFMSWLNEQNIFKSVGRIVVFLNEPGTSVLEHRDYSDGISRKDQFIWFSPNTNKRFYVRDDTEKHYMESKFCYFDSSNIHGSDIIDTNTFSIRVDGLFSEEFKEKAGLKDHFNDIK